MCIRDSTSSVPTDRYRPVDDKTESSKIKQRIIASSIFDGIAGSTRTSYSFVAPIYRVLTACSLSLVSISSTSSISYAVRKARVLLLYAVFVHSSTNKF